jgi:large subunit ribosomal protein L18
MLERQIKRQRRHRRVRAKAAGTAQKPRLCVFKSSKHIYVQLINDEKGEILAAATDWEIKKAKIVKKNPLAGEPSTDGEKKIKPLSGNLAKAYEIGKLIAAKAIEKKIKKVVFDRGGYKYHGVVKALADGAREGGLEF